MRRRTLVSATLVCLTCVTVGAAAPAVTVTSDPPGAEVWVAPPDQPCLYRKGLTPCQLTLSPAAAPYRLVLRAAGCFPLYRTLGATDSAVAARLLRHDDPANWQGASLLWGAGWRSGALWWGTGTLPPRQFTALPRYPETQARWSPDGEALLVRGMAWSRYVAELGLGRKEEDRELCDLWYVPLTGTSARVWRYLSGPDGGTRFEIDSGFSPDGRWVVHSTPEVTREHLELYSTVSGRRQVLARAPLASIFKPGFSPDGRRLACLRYQEAKQGSRRYREWEEPPSELQVMQWNGADRRTVASDACSDYAAAFSPDASQLAYVRIDGAVAVVPAGGGTPRVVLSAKQWVGAASPAWAPDGSTLAADFAPAERDRHGGRPGQRRVMWARLDGSAAGVLPAVSLHGWHDAGSLEVYADGYCAAAEAPYRRLLRVGLDGEQKAVLYRGLPVVHRPATAPDNAHAAALESSLEGRQAVLVVTAADHSVRRFEEPRLEHATAIGWLDSETLWVRLAAGNDPPGYRLSLAAGALAPLTEFPRPPPRDDLGPPGGPGDDEAGTGQPWDGFVPGGNWQIALPGARFGSLAPTIPAGGEAR